MPLFNSSFEMSQISDINNMLLSILRSLSKRCSLDKEFVFFKYASTRYVIVYERTLRNIAVDNSSFI